MEKPPFFSPSPRLQVQRAVQHLRVQRLHRATLVRHVPHDLIHPPGTATQRRLQRQVEAPTTLHGQRSRPLRPHASTSVPPLRQRPPLPATPLPPPPHGRARPQTPARPPASPPPRPPYQTPAAPQPPSPPPPLPPPPPPPPPLPPPPFPPPPRRQIPRRTSCPPAPP